MDNHPTVTEVGDRDLAPRSARLPGIEPEPGSPPAASKPLSAYRLGLGSRLAWKWNQAFCEMPCDSHAENVSLALTHLRVDRVALGEEMPPDVFEELGRLLDTIEERARTFAAMLVAESDDESLDHHARRPPDWPLYVRLADLTDRALVNGHELRPLFDFGAALGALLQEAWGRDPRTFSNRDESELYRRWLDARVPEPLPDVGSLIRRSRDLPNELLWQVPHLMTLGRLSLELDGPGQGSILGKFLAVHPDLCPYSDDGQYVSLGVVSRMAHGLDDRVQEGLTKLGDGLESPPPLHDERLLSWNKNTGELKYANVVIRKLAPQSTTARPVLDQFQSNNWAKWVSNPFHEKGYAERLKQALRTLKKGLTVIRFRLSEGNGVSYEWVDDA